MKPEETQLISELSELQSMVSELKVGFSSALLELSHIQQEDTRLRADLEQTKQHCDRETLQLRTLVYSLKTDLQDVRYQICQLHKDQQKPQQLDGVKGLGSSQTPRNSCACQASGRCQSDSTTPAPPPPQPANLLLHCYLQGLRAGLSPVTENPAPTQASSRLPGPSPVPLTLCNTNTLQDSSPEAKRQQVVLDLFHSEQEYLSTLFQLHDKYKTLSALPKNHGTCQMFVAHLEQLSQHSLLFRNALEERVYSKHWQGLVGDVFARLTCQNESTFMGIYHGYVRMLPIVLSNLHQSNGKMHISQDSPQERDELLQVSQLLTPVSRIHSYLTHIQDLLQWTGREHPDHYWLQVSKRALRNVLNQCHVILEQGGRQGDREKAGHSSPAPPVCTLQSSSQHNTGSKTLTPSDHCEPVIVTNRSEPDSSSHVANGNPAPILPGSRCPNLQGSEKRTHGHGRAPYPFTPPQQPPGASCRGNGGFLLGAADPGGEGSGRGPAQGPGPQGMKGSFEDCDTDLDDLGDASVFDYSSVTSCSPDGGLLMRQRDVLADEEDEDEEEEEEEEEDSQVPVLLKPTGADTQTVQRHVSGEGSVPLGMQAPRVPPHPPPGKPRTPYAGQPTPGPKTMMGNGVSAPLNISTPQRPPARPLRATGPASSEQRETMRERKMAHSTTARPLDPRRPRDRGGTRSVLGVAFSRIRLRGPQVTGNACAWEDSEDSDGPCSTV